MSISQNTSDRGAYFSTNGNSQRSGDQDIENMAAQAAGIKEAENGDKSLYLVQFEDGDSQNPKNFNPVYKARLVFQMSLLAMAGSLGSSIISPAQSSIAQAMNVSNEATSLTVALFVLGL